MKIVMILLWSHIPNMNYQVIVCSASVEFTQWKMRTNEVYYNRFPEKMIPTIKIFIIAFSQNGHDKVRKFAVTQQKNPVVKTKLLQ